MIDCQSHGDLNYEDKTKHRKVLLWGNTLVSVIKGVVNIDRDRLDTIGRG